MGTIATRPTGEDVTAFLDAVPNGRRCADGHALRDPLLDDLGPHTTGKGCLYLETLSDADPAVLEQLVHNAWTSVDHS